MCKIPSNFKWSFSKISAYESCPMMFRLCYLEHVKDDGNPFSDYGTFAHSILEGWAKGEIPDFLMAETYKEGYDAAITHSFPPFPRGMGEKYYEAGLAYFENFSGFGDEWEVVSAEEKFELDIGGYPFVGISDLILQHKETKELWVIDHKSKSASSMSKELQTYRRQLYIYAAHVKQKYGVYPSKLSFNMFKEGTFIDEVFDINMFNDTMEWVVEMIESILFEADWKISPSSYFCRFICPALMSCPAKEAVLNPPPTEKKTRKKKDESSCTTSS